MDPDPEAPTGLVGGPVEVDDLLGGEQIDAGHELTRRRQAVCDFLDQIL